MKAILVIAILAGLGFVPAEKILTWGYKAFLFSVVAIVGGAVIWVPALLIYANRN